MSISLDLHRPDRSHVEGVGVGLESDLVDYLAALQNEYRSLTHLVDLDPYGDRKFPSAVVAQLATDVARLLDDARARRCSPPPDQIDLETYEPTYRPFGWKGFITFLIELQTLLATARWQRTVGHR